LGSMQTREFAPRLSAGKRLFFSLRANATKDKRIDGAGHGSRTRRVDLIMDRLYEIEREKRKDHRSVIAQEIAESWLSRQGEQKGFKSINVVAENYNQIRLKRNRAANARFGILDITGEIAVTDPDLFITGMAGGYGRAKAWGCGLMLIRPAA